MYIQLQFYWSCIKFFIVQNRSFQSCCLSHKVFLFLIEIRQISYLKIKEVIIMLGMHLSKPVFNHFTWCPLWLSPTMYQHHSYTVCCVVLILWVGDISIWTSIDLQCMQTSLEWDSVTWTSVHLQCCGPLYLSLLVAHVCVGSCCISPTILQQTIHNSTGCKSLSTLLLSD